MGAQGSTTINFGSFPGSPEATVDVTGQTGLISSSKIEGWTLPIATTDHSVDDHVEDNLFVTAYYKVDGTLTIKGKIVPFTQIMPINPNPPLEGGGAQRYLLYGQYTVGWVWV